MNIIIGLKGFSSLDKCIMSMCNIMGVFSFMFSFCNVIKCQAHTCILSTK